MGDTGHCNEDVPVNAPILSAEDLKGFGVDGTSEWLQHFSTQLSALRAAAHQSGHSNTPVELLLRLVCNIIDKPSEPRFRRLRAENPKIQSSLLGVAPEAKTLLKLLGFEES